VCAPLDGNTYLLSLRRRVRHRKEMEAAFPDETLRPKASHLRADALTEVPEERAAWRKTHPKKLKEGGVARRGEEGAVKANFMIGLHRGPAATYRVYDGLGYMASFFGQVRRCSYTMVEGRSQTNELLPRMESYSGVLICRTSRRTSAGRPAMFGLQDRISAARRGRPHSPLSQPAGNGLFVQIGQ